jgi:hypothetical protein
MFCKWQARVLEFCCFVNRFDILALSFVVKVKGKINAGVDVIKFKNSLGSLDRFNT